MTHRCTSHVHRTQCNSSVPCVSYHSAAREYDCPHGTLSGQCINRGDCHLPSTYSSLAGHHRKLGRHHLQASKSHWMLLIVQVYRLQGQHSNQILLYMYPDGMTGTKVDTMSGNCRKAASPLTSGHMYASVADNATTACRQQ